METYVKFSKKGSNHVSATIYIYVYYNVNQQTGSCKSMFGRQKILGFSGVFLIQKPFKKKRDKGGINKKTTCKTSKRDTTQFRSVCCFLHLLFIYHTYSNIGECYLDFLMKPGFHPARRCMPRSWAQ